IAKGLGVAATWPGCPTDLLTESATEPELYYGTGLSVKQNLGKGNMDGSFLDARSCARALWNGSSAWKDGRTFHARADGLTIPSFQSKHRQFLASDPRLPAECTGKKRVAKTWR
ncbi:hypothetical protein GT037_005380, partial [Alternaria burnsii]